MRAFFSAGLLVLSAQLSIGPARGDSPTLPARQRWAPPGNRLLSLDPLGRANVSTKAGTEPFGSLRRAAGSVATSWSSSQCSQTPQTLRRAQRSKTGMRVTRPSNTATVATMRGRKSLRMPGTPPAPIHLARTR